MLTEYKFTEMQFGWIITKASKGVIDPSIASYTIAKFLSSSDPARPKSHYLPLTSPNELSQIRMPCRSRFGLLEAPLAISQELETRPSTTNHPTRRVLAKFGREELSALQSLTQSKSSAGEFHYFHYTSKW